MEKLDRLGWAAGVAFTSYGVRVGVRANRRDVLDRVLDCFPPGWKPAVSPLVERLYSVIAGDDRPGGRTRRLSLVYGNLDRLARTAFLDEAIESLESDLQVYIAERARRRVFLHAGVVGWRGLAVVVPGRSFAGKSTLVAEMVRAGATYYSDEYAVLDAAGRVHPYAKPLALRQSDCSKQSKHSVAELGGVAGARALPVGLVVVTEYRAGATWRPRRLSAGRGALALLANTVSARSNPDRALAVLQHVVSRAPVLKGARGEAKRFVESVLGYLEEGAQDREVIR